LVLGGANLAQEWIGKYESKDLPETVKKLVQQVMPLYKKLHAYLRRKLWEKYGDIVIDRTDSIPAHVVGECGVLRWQTYTALILV
jgi:hypothetical protein